MTGFFPEWTWIVGFVVGATVGSFLNMLIYRLPRMGPGNPDLTLTKPSYSICPKCNHRLDWIDLMPLVSWLIQRGKCRYCDAPISARYFSVELVTGGLWAAVWYQFFIASDQPAKAVAYSFAMAGLVALSWIDWESYTIPDSLNVFLLVIAFAYHAYSGSIDVALWGAFWGWAILYGIGLLGRLLFGKDAMGEGDIMLMRAIGALIGIGPLIIAVAIAVFTGAVHGITMKVIDTMRPKPALGEGEEEAPAPAQPVGQTLIIGVILLFGIDVLAYFLPPVGRLIDKVLPDAPGLSDEAWEPPSIRYIPFGPFLALGTAIVMIWESGVKQLIENYMKQFGGA